MTDFDGNREDRSDTVSVFNGPPPTIQSLKNMGEKIKVVADWMAARKNSRQRNVIFLLGRVSTHRHIPRIWHRVVLFTLLGGEAFGNEAKWINAAIRRALAMMSSSGLDVRFASYGTVARDRAIARDFAQKC